MVSWFTNLSSYYLRLEQQAMLSAVLLFLAWLSFAFSPSFALTAVLFVVYSLALFNGGPTLYLLSRLRLRRRLFGPMKPTAKEWDYIVRPEQPATPCRS